MNIQEIYDYAKLETLAYVDLSASSSPKEPDTIIQAKIGVRLPS